MCGLACANANANVNANAIRFDGEERGKAGRVVTAYRRDWSVQNKLLTHGQGNRIAVDPSTPSALSLLSCPRSVECRDPKRRVPGEHCVHSRLIGTDGNGIPHKPCPSSDSGRACSTGSCHDDREFSNVSLGKLEVTVQDAPPASRPSLQASLLFWSPRSLPRCVLLANGRSQSKLLYHHLGFSLPRRGALASGFLPRGLINPPLMLQC